MIGIVNYGSGNLYNLQRGVRAAGTSALLVSMPAQVLACRALLLPGVGAFGDGMRKLRQARLDEAVTTFLGFGRPLLGICLGMQLLFSRSQEFGRHEGLGVMSGEVEAIPPEPGLAVPHVGWEPLAAATAHPLLAGIGPQQEVYFAHSFVCRPQDQGTVVARVAYGSRQFTAAVARDNVMGCQFHPEMSAEAGIRILKNFLRIAYGAH